MQYHGDQEGTINKGSIARINYKSFYCSNSLQTFEIKLYRLVCEVTKGQVSSKETVGMGV